MRKPKGFATQDDDDGGPMKYACMSCDTRYDIPDEKIAEKEPNGLRIRCRTCRAIMVVSLARRLDEDESEDVTAPALVRRRQKPRQAHSARPGAGLASRTSSQPQVDAEAAMAAGGFDLPDFTGVHAANGLDGKSLEIPATTTERGDVVAKSGIFRSLTGVHLSPAAAKKDRAIWFAALGGKPRGPYTAKEMKRLAEQGRVRGSTLVWGPSLNEWSQVRSRTGEKRELAWLRDVVIARKHHERAAQNRAQEVHGITRLQLEPQQLKSTPPPPLPLDDESTDSEFHADAVFGPTHLGSVSPALVGSDDGERGHGGNGDGNANDRGFPMAALIAVGLLTGAVAAAGVFYALASFGLYAFPSVSP